MVAAECKKRLFFQQKHTYLFVNSHRKCTRSGAKRHGATSGRNITDTILDEDIENDLLPE